MGENFTISPAKTTETMLTSLIKMFKLGPEVSLNGSPTVSPTTPALWASEPFPPYSPVSIHFLALSQAPPALAMKIATANPQTKVPTSIPITPGTPSVKFMLRTAPDVTPITPTWTYSNQLCSVHIPEDMVPHGSNAYASGQVTWVCGMTYGGGFQIRGKRDDNSTQTDPVYPHNDSTFLTVRKVG